MSRRKRGRVVHGILLLDKPTGITSNRALQQVKHLFDAQKAGHTGTLDPLATGMLPLCFGEATKMSGYLLDADKEYLAGARFGVTTDTADSEGNVLQTRALPKNFGADALREVMQGFTGPIQQVPPMYSALKHNGKRLHELARSGETVERKPRDVVIALLELLTLENDLAMFRVRCSKGTYIRTLVEDIGEAIGCGAHIISLRRTEVSPFASCKMHLWDELEALAEPESMQALDQCLLPIDRAINHLPIVTLDAPGKSYFQQGRSVGCPSIAGLESGSLLRAYGPAGDFLGLATSLEGGAEISPKKVLNL